MALSVQSIENLIDLVEIKLGAIEVYGGSRGQNFKVLEATQCELRSQLAEKTEARNHPNVVGLAGRYKRAAPSAA